MEESLLTLFASADGFFGDVGATVAVFDPWILFDDETQRFFAIGIDIVRQDAGGVDNTGEFYFR